MKIRKILFLRGLQNEVFDECDACNKNKLLEYLAMDENNTMFTLCKECGEHLKIIMDNS